MKSLLKYALYRALGLLARVLRVRRHERPVEGFRRVLLSEISLMGDVVSVTASFATARKLWPEARIDVLVLREYTPLVRHDPRIDEVLQLRDMRAASYVTALLAARRRRYDLALAMSPGLRNAGAALLGGAEASAGYLVDRGFPPHFLNRQRIEAAGVGLARHIEAGGETHIADRGLRVLDAMGAEVPAEGRPEVVVSREAQARTAAFLRSAGLAGKRFAVLHPGAGEERRRWPAERFAELARLLRDELGLATVWTGPRAEIGPIAEARFRSSPSSAIFVDRTLDELAALLRNAALFVGNDSGPMHLAGAARTPLVGIFGPGDPARLLPRNTNARAVGRRAGDPDRPDVTHVSVDEAMEGIRKALAEGGGR
jgi:heptosyltransferase-1